jgi:hypothetical protein
LNINLKYVGNYIAIAAVSLLATACVVVAPLPANTDKQNTGRQDTGGHTAAQSSASLCNIEGQQVQDLSDGSTKATITQSCQETSIFIQNNHAEHPKRCQVMIGNKSSELYLRPGESRSLTQAGPSAKSAVQVKCANDSNRTR